MTSLEKLQLEKLHNVIDSCIKVQTSSLSRFLNKPLGYSLEKIIQTEFNKIEEKILKFASHQVCAVYVACEGDLRIEFLFFLDIDEAEKLASLLSGKEQQRLVGMGKSSIVETGNILAGAFLNTLSSKTGLHIQPSVPGLAIDRFETVLGTPLADIVRTTDEVIFIESQFSSVKDQVVIQSIIMLDPEGTRKILGKTKGDAR